MILFHFEAVNYAQTTNTDFQFQLVRNQQRMIKGVHYLRKNGIYQNNPILSVIIVIFQ